MKERRETKIKSKRETEITPKEVLSQGEIAEERRETEITPKEVLSQEEVDLLLRSLRGGKIPIREEKEVGEEEKEKSPRYDFRKVGRFISKMRLPSLEVIHRRFANDARSILSAALQKIIDISMVSVSVGEFGSFLDNIPLPASFVVVSLNPLRGLSVWALEGPLVLSIIDILLGGMGKPVKAEGREFTRIEQRLLRRILLTLLKVYQHSWEPILRIEPEIVRLENHPQFVMIVPEADLVVSTRYDIDLGTVTGKMYIAIPYSTLEPIRTQLQTGYQPSGLGIDRKWLERLINRLSECPVSVRVELGRARITLRELLNLKKGDLIKLNTAPDEPSALVYIQDVPKYVGIPGVINEATAVMVTKVIKTEEEAREEILRRILV
ncbi:MAG: flagellar motor switch protein FliM [Candidatus Calescibacterium sp.]|jgi:flagellar motor switch protein FliM